MRVEPFKEASRLEWDQFVRQSKNGTFLFCRNYLEYHCDRFPDSSVLVRDDRGRLIALLPVHRTGDMATTHAGLTYGGFVCDESMKTPLMLCVFDATLSYLREHGIAQLLYKTIPYIYHRYPAEEDRYALWLAGARWVRSSILAAVDQRARLKYQERRVRSVRKACKAGLVVERTHDFKEYWAMLSELLLNIYDARPVHSLEEIQLLAARFPQEIQLYGGFKSGAMVAGVVIYETATTARVQYAASNEWGRETGAVDLIYDHLLNEVFRDKRYFDFGSSEESGGQMINEGLIDQKEGFGARAVALDQYIINLQSWEPGKLLNVLK